MMIFHIFKRSGHVYVRSPRFTVESLRVSISCCGKRLLLLLIIRFLLCKQPDERAKQLFSSRCFARCIQRAESRRFLVETHNMLLTETRVAVLNNEKCNIQQQRPTTRVSEIFGLKLPRLPQKFVAHLSCLFFDSFSSHFSCHLSFSSGWACLPVSEFALLLCTLLRMFFCCFAWTGGNSRWFGVEVSLFSDPTVDIDAVEVNLTPFVCDTSTQNVTRCEHCRQQPNSIHKSIDFVL